MNKLVLAALAVAGASAQYSWAYDPVPVGSQPYFDTSLTVKADLMYTDTYFAGNSPTLDPHVTNPSQSTNIETLFTYITGTDWHIEGAGLEVKAYAKATLQVIVYQYWTYNMNINFNLFDIFPFTFWWLT